MQKNRLSVAKTATSIREIFTFPPWVRETYGTGQVRATAGVIAGAEVRPQAMADELGCDTFTATTTEELGVREIGTCNLDGKEVRLLTFASNDARDTYVKIASEFGGRYVVKDRQVFTSDDGATVDAINAKVSGEIR